MIHFALNTGVTKGKISKHIYGHFSEHLGRCIYGGIWVGEDSPVPNTRGIRKDVVEALKKAAIPNLRWPGGCFADEYHWRDGIGPRPSRPGTLNVHWGGVTENNHFGTHEFMDLCEQTGADPYICGNVGSGTVREMREWVEYITFDGKSSMADLRRENGRDKPWKLPFFGVGNESWGCGGNMRPEYYADLYRRYACFVRDFSGNRVQRIACGPNSSDYRWTEVLMREAADVMDGLSLHHYTITNTWQNKGSATVFTEQEWCETMRKTWFMDELIARHSAVMDQYDQEKKVGLIVDEWGTWFEVEPGTNPGFLYQQNTLRDALVAGIHLNIFNAHCGRVRMANIAQTVNVLQAMVLTEGDRMVLTPTYHVFNMYRVHQDADLLSLDLTGGEHFLPGGGHALSASASRDASGRVHVSLCNAHPRDAVSIRCALHGEVYGKADGTVLTHPDMTAHNTFDRSERVSPGKFTGARIVNGSLEAELPAHSVVVLELSA